MHAKTTVVVTHYSTSLAIWCAGRETMDISLGPTGINMHHTPWTRTLALRHLAQPNTHTHRHLQYQVHPSKSFPAHRHNRKTPSIYISRNTCGRFAMRYDRIDRRAANLPNYPTPRQSHTANTRSLKASSPGTVYQMSQPLYRRESPHIYSTRLDNFSPELSARPTPRPRARGAHRVVFLTEEPAEILPRVRRLNLKSHGDGRTYNRCRTIVS